VRKIASGYGMILPTMLRFVRKAKLAKPEDPPRLMGYGVMVIRSLQMWERGHEGTGYPESHYGTWTGGTIIAQGGS
jgi:hypothetical protein